MSSHHIVREKQEPALLIAGLEHFDDELLGQLLEWSPTVVVTAAVAEQVQSRGIKIDWLLADEMTHVQQSDIKLVPPGNDQPVTVALKQLMAQSYHAVNLVTDKLDIALLTPFFEQVDLVVFCDSKKIVAVRNGFRKWKPAADRIEILTPAHNFVYTNLSPVAYNCYEIVHDGFYSLQFNNSFILVAEAL